MNKYALRKQISSKLQKIDGDSHYERSIKIHESLFRTNVWKQSQSIGVTISRTPEIDTYSIIKRAWLEGKKVSVPKCKPADRSMIFYRIESFNDVEPSFYGLLEPVETLNRTKSSEIDLMIVPGLAYTKTGYRLGYGGGYYDRYLPNYGGVTLSLCFDEQLVEDLPVENHDQPVEMLIGEDFVLASNLSSD
ncbi:5-formyltetrahydrofolate cyclo-ligase [Jeotgalibacillus campisalis]|uniref:5-formyltetrahydrofolate cyclo-ligase n=1 Tax=Jeotgalibacillus campisalis TaxID=220754 RepID=A0A0C2VPT1_9BACL|nr:5-formyltetrahydrofolate cyclo-ligase [Jeotgalibacillus campisalis]KIL45993.1 hypothetical protein KR50_26680 [Jeotgalibacillus campisalis]